MSRFKNLLWGLLLVVIGVIIGLNALGVTDITIFFKGWWTLFIIVPSAIGLFDKGSKTGNIIGLLIGVALLLACQEYITFDILWKLALPVILVILGIAVIFKDVSSKKINKKIESLKKDNNEKTNKENEFCAVFSGQTLNFTGEQFKGATLNAIFGGIKCDLSCAIIDEDVLINADAIFGGIDIFLPSDVKVKVKSSSLFGGVTNKTIPSEDALAPTVYINTNCMFGGVDVK